MRGRIAHYKRKRIESTFNGTIKSDSSLFKTQEQVTAIRLKIRIKDLVQITFSYDGLIEEQNENIFNIEPIIKITFSYV